MKYREFSTLFAGKHYRLSRWMGWLMSSERKPRMAPCAQDIKAAWEAVENPFLCNREYPPLERRELRWWQKTYARLLVFLCKHVYPIAYMIGHLRTHAFDNAVEAADVFRQATRGMNQNTLCLPRSIFIMTTSGRFAREGAMLIGVFLPSHSMHAWVMEDGRPADRFDNIWTLYTPLLMIE